MRIRSLAALSWAYSASIAAASAVGQVYVYDHDTPSKHTPTPEKIDPQTARLIFAQRLGLAQFHTVSGADDVAIRRVNDFGGRQHQLFASDTQDAQSRVMVVVEGIEEPLTVPALADFNSFSISPAPHPSDSLELFSGFSSEAAQVPFTEGPDYRILRALAPLSELESNTLDTYNNRRSLLYVKSVAKASKNDRNEQLQTVSSVITKLYDLAKEGHTSLSIMFMPPEHLCSKRSTNAYGLTKRAAKAQRAEPEKLLSAPSPSASTKTSNNVSPVVATKVLTGPIPTCFSSRGACERSTNNCTLHGECILKWSAESTGEDGSISKHDCYGCACTKPEVRKNKDGSKKTTHFGGGACHKKDISMPFWLLAGTSIFLVSILSWGLGLLYSMGYEELPSVIGAGVSGPKAR